MTDEAIIAERKACAELCHAVMMRHRYGGDWHAVYDDPEYAKSMGAEECRDAIMARNHGESKS